MTRRNNAVGPQIQGNGENGKKGKNTVLLILLITVVIAGFALATQYFAHQFDYQAALGGNFEGIYPPWKIMTWYFKWGGEHQRTLLQAISLGTLVSAAGMMGLLGYRVVSERSSHVNEFLHGSAQWADRQKIEEAGFLPRAPKGLIKRLVEKKPEPVGVFVGAWIDEKGRQQYLRHDGPEHVLCFAPTRSGKGVGLVNTTLLTWPDSCVITDLKGELWALTAGWRSQHANNKVLRFEPASPTNCVKWNPLEEIRIGTEWEVGDAQNLATMIVDPKGEGLNDHWSKTAFALLTGCILHLCYKKKNDNVEAHMGALDYMLADPNRPIAELWDEMITYNHTGEGPHPAISTAAQDMKDRPEEEAGSVLSTAKSFFSLYRDPVVARNVSKSEFKIRDLMHYDQPISLYIVTEPTDKLRLRPLVRVMVGMIFRLLADKMAFEKGRTKRNYKYRLLAMLDEFPSLGRLEIIEESLAFVAGYGMKKNGQDKGLKHDKA